MCVQVFLHIHAYKRIDVALLGSLEGVGARRFLTLRLTLMIKLMYLTRAAGRRGAAEGGGPARRVAATAWQRHHHRCHASRGAPRSVPATLTIPAPA